MSLLLILFQDLKIHITFLILVAMATICLVIQWPILQKKCYQNVTKIDFKFHYCYVIREHIMIGSFGLKIAKS